MEQDRDAPRDHPLEGVGDPAVEDTTLADVPPPVDPALVDRTRRLQQEIAEDERVLQQETQQQ